MKVSFSKLGNALKDAAALTTTSDNWVEVDCYAGGPFQLSICCHKHKDGYFFYFMDENNETEGFVLQDGKFSQAIKDAFDSMGLSDDLLDHIEISKSEMNKLENIKNSQLLENCNSIFERIYEANLKEAEHYEVAVTCKYNGKIQKFSWSAPTEEEALALCERKKSEFLDDSSEPELLKIEFNKTSKPTIYYEV